MTDEMRNHISKLRELAPVLNKATDEANATVRRVEAFLNEECSIGIPAESHEKYPKALEKHRVRRHGIGYLRHGGKYRICVIIIIEQWDRDGNLIQVMDREETPWESAPREAKLRVLPFLPTMLGGLVSVAEDMAKSTEAATKSVNEILSALPTKK